MCFIFLSSGRKQINLQISCNEIVFWLLSLIMKLQVLSCKLETSVGLVVLQQQVRKSKEVDAVFVLAALP
jgi:hypothetical protein